MSSSMDPTSLIPGQRVRIMVTGVVRAHEAVVTDRKHHGWCVLKVVAPEDSNMFGAELGCEDYVLLG